MMFPAYRLLAVASVSACLNGGCAALFKVQLSDINAGKGRPVSVKVSETTVDFGEISRIAKGLGKASGSRGLQSAGKGISAYEMLFQFGPRTGAPVFNEFYARDIAERLAAECTTGYLSNIISIRESREYPVVKGQIVRIDATCMQP